MKIYVHKHLKLELEFWETIEKYMKDNNLNNFTELIRSSLLLKIHQR